MVFFFAVGELLEGVAAGRARAGIQALAALAPKTALLLEGGQVREVPADSLSIGQTVQIHPGARVPADGHHPDRHLQPGRQPGDRGERAGGQDSRSERLRGQHQPDGVLTVRVDKSASDNTIARIIHLVEEAEGSKAPTARFIDRFSRCYTPGVVAVAALVAVVPPLFFGGEWHAWLYKGISLLLIGCPCALVLSVPAAITSGVSAGARRGLLIKGGAALETHRQRQDGGLRQDRHPDGRAAPRHRRGGRWNGDETEVLRLAAAVEAGSEPSAGQSHPAGSRRQTADRFRPAATPEALPGKARHAPRWRAGSLSVASPRYAASLADRSRLPLQSARSTPLKTQGRTAVVLLRRRSPAGPASPCATNRARMPGRRWPQLQRPRHPDR